jgi:hypothetical protein
VSFLVPEKGESDPIRVGKSFVIIATLSTQNENIGREGGSSGSSGGSGISFALRNRFVTIQVKEPILNFSTREDIAKCVVKRLTKDKIDTSLKSESYEYFTSSSVPEFLCPEELTNNEVNSISKVVAEKTLDSSAVRDVASLATAVSWSHKTILCNDPKDLVRACMLDAKWLASEDSEKVVSKTVRKEVDGQKQRYFYDATDGESPMWQVMASICVSSISAQNLFLQVYLYLDEYNFFVRDLQVQEKQKL